MSEHRDFEQLAAGYALHALEPAEEQLLAVHLLSCATCPTQIAEAESVTTALAEAVAAAVPPEGLRERILRAASREPRAYPIVKEQLPARSAPRLVRNAHRRRVPGRLLTGALAALVGIAIAIPTTLALSRSDTGGGGDGVLAQKLLEPGSREVSLTSMGNVAQAKAVLSPTGALVVVDELPANDARRTTYVLWAANKSGQRTAMATFDVSNGKAVEVATTSLPFTVNDITQIAVSYERGRVAPQAPSDIVLSGTGA